MNRTILIAVFFTLSFKHYAQYNIVPNPGFEGVSQNFSCPGWINDSGDNSEYFDWSNINGWTHIDESTFPKFPGNHSLGAAWWESYYCSGNVINNARTGSSNARIKTYISNDCACVNNCGDYGYITTHLSEPLKSGHKYLIEYYIKPAPGSLGYGMSISALLTLQKPSNCRASRIQTTVTFQGSYTTSTTFNGTNWLKVSGYFIATDASEWLTIGCFDQVSNVSSYVNGFFLIDDVRLEEKYYCSDVCTPNLPAVTEAYNSGSQFNTYPIVMAASRTPWLIFAANAIGIDFTVWDRWGNEFYHQHQFNVNGLIDAGFSDYAFFWRGKNDQGNYVEQDVYNYRIRIWNCISEINYTNSFTYLRDSYDDPPNAVTNNPNLNDCCPANKYIQNKQYNTSMNELGRDFIIAGSNVTTGTTGPVVVNSGAVVRYVSNSVQLQAGFSVALGGDFKTIITDDCKYARPAKWANPLSVRPSHISAEQENTEISEFHNSDNEFSFYPNPSSDGIFTLNASHVLTIRKIEVYNIYGDLILTFNKSEFNRILNLSDQSSGVYLCKIFPESGMPSTIRIAK